MDLVDLITEKRFLGQEFLTWLWWKSEERGGAVMLEGQGDISVVFEKHMLLEYGEAEYSERLVCSGLQTELREARTGLRTGKKLEQARIQIVRNEHEYNLTLGATFFEYRNVRLPKTMATESSGQSNRPSEEETEAMILERVFLFEELVRIINDLFRMFVNIRTSSAWQEELTKIRAWVHKSADSV
jgi:recombination associated protein RdgC